jgi:hypothetical protein
MPERPPAIMQLNSLLGAVTIAHEAIFEMRRELIARDQGNPEQARLLTESARIVTVELPGLSAVARRLSARWQEQSLLDTRGRRRRSLNWNPSWRASSPVSNPSSTGSER